MSVNVSPASPRFDRCMTSAIHDALRLSVKVRVRDIRKARINP